MYSTKGFFGIFLFSILACYCAAQKGRDLPSIFEWKELEYKFPTDADRAQAIKDGLYVHGKGLPYDVDVFYDKKNTSRIFVTVPRFNTGIPSSMNTISNLRAEGGPQLMPYPDYTWHNSHGKDCDGMTSVCRVAIDECNRIWILDMGRIGREQHCPPQLLVFDLHTDTLIHRYRFPETQFKSGISLFATPTVDVRDPPPYRTCQNTMVYIADLTGYGIVVYDFNQNTSWRIENKLMYPSPEFGTFNIAGESFDLMAGIISIVLTPQSLASGNNRVKRYDSHQRHQNHNHNHHNHGGMLENRWSGNSGPTTASRPSTSTRPSQGAGRNLYFHSLSGETENMVPLDIVDNRTIWTEGSDTRQQDFVIIGRRGTQSGPSAMDSRGNMYFGLEEDLAITSWNINTPYNRENFKLIAENPTTLQFVSGMKVKRNQQSVEELWAVSNRLQKEYRGTFNSDEVNFRIMATNIGNNSPISLDRRDSFIFPHH